MKRTSAHRNNEQLWGYCKAEAVDKMGKFSARAMQYAVKLYKERGGGYIGKKTESNSLVKWAKSGPARNSSPQKTKTKPGIKKC
ncbi:MAG: hypothetical protein RLZZ67_388 [Candidatus Parcubacteria bacterium]|jgi:hypothetical protein